MVEIMVGMIIGLIGTLVVLQVFTVFEGQKRTTTTGSDAQTNGALALYTIERDVRMAGYGTSASALDCSSFFSYYDNGTSAPGPLNGFSTTPLRITDGGMGSDSISIQYSTSPGGALSTPIRTNMVTAATELSVNSTYGCNIKATQNNLVLVSEGNNCTLMQLTTTDQPGLKLYHVNSPAPTYNPTAGYMSTNSWPLYTTAAKVSCLGDFTSRTYSIDASPSLQVQESTSATPIQLQEGIVSLQAQYGIALAGSQQVTSWVNATGLWAAPTAADVKRIKAIRIAVVARSGLIEKNNVTGTCTTTGGTVNNGPCAWNDTVAFPAPAIDLSGDANWQRYRYKVFETIVPLKNVIWANI
ncbi:hypothetical protein SCT_3218 [Sulfuricella sp. T08]|nr:hypothetical protein SCT_3218 [Sulfuricella sp. T08]